MDETKSQKFTRTLNELASDAHNTSVDDAVDLDTIPREEWHLHVGAFVKIPKGTPAFHLGDHTSIEAALDWMKEYFKMQGSEFYINSNLFTQEDSDFGISTGFYLEKVPNRGREQIIQSRVDELYQLWQKTGHADRPGYEKSDAETKIRTLKSGQLFSKYAKAMSIGEILGE
jgi:hypothetical protein